MDPVRFGDKYILLDQIGAGGVAEVFRGKLTREQGFEKLIVIKKLLPEHNADREMVDTFIGEARLAALLQHENIAATYDFGELDGEYFLAMEYLFGKNLYAVMARARDHQAQFTPAHALAVCSRICEGMEYAHNLNDLQNKPLNLVHRDLTPHNIFITYDGRVKILDFGVAKAEMFDNKTREGVVKGKISYMSPERLSGEDVDSRSDIFSIGILLYEMLGKSRMYQGDTAELIRKCLTADYKNLREVVPDLDPQIYEILDRALAVDVAQRYKSCSEMQADLDDLLFDLHHRVDSKFLKDSIQGLFAQEYDAEQHMVAALFSDFNEAKLLKRDKTDISIPRKLPRKKPVEDDHDKTVVLAYQPAVQLVKAKTAELSDWSRRVFEESKSRVAEADIDRRYLMGGAAAGAGVLLLILVAVMSGGDDDSSALVTQEETPPAAAARVIEPVETPVPAEEPIEQAKVVETEDPQTTAEESAAQVERPAPPPDVVSSPEVVPPSKTAAPEGVPPQSVPPDTAKVPVLKTSDMKIKKQVTGRLPEPQKVKSTAPTSAAASPLYGSMESMPAAKPVDVAGQTLSFEEEAADRAKRRNILMLHTRAEEAMQQGRLLEPVQSSAYTYYHRILELDAEDERARNGLRLIGDKYAAVAETALVEKQYDRAAQHVSNGLQVMPGYPRLVAIDERIKRERAEQVHILSEKARLCLDAGKLSTPADDSAYYYYNEILRLDPDSDLARKGYQKIADKYAVLADHSFQEFDYDQAETYVRKGLQVNPNHYYLLSLQQELKRSDLERVGHSVKKRINKLFSE